MGATIYDSNGKLRAVVKIYDHPVVTLVKPTSPHSYVSMAFVEKNIGPRGTWTEVPKVPLGIELPGVKMVDYELEVNVEFNDCIHPIKFKVPIIDDKRYIVLGMDFVHLFNTYQLVDNKVEILSNIIETMAIGERQKELEPDAMDVDDEESSKEDSFGGCMRKVPLKDLNEVDISLEYRLAILEKVKEMRQLQDEEERRYRATVLHKYKRAKIDMAKSTKTTIFL